MTIPAGGTLSTEPADERWLLLIHQIPPKPDYLRVKIGRRLQRVGAAPVKNSVYVLPDTDQALEDFQWIRTEIVDAGGEALICRAELLDGLTDDEIGALLGAARAKLRATARETCSRAVTVAEYRDRTWVTRDGVFVDRMASAWLIGRFIDPTARFKFVSARGYRPTKDEVTFDMFEGDFTHEGDRCTFETLLARFSLGDAALHTLAEIVHDIDVKDGKFARVEAAGIERVVAGIVGAHADDAARIERGRQLFDELYASVAEG